MIGLNLRTRPATEQDRQALSNLIFRHNHAHRHLDWRPPLDWLGSPHFWVIEESNRILAALACPPDPPRVAWIRLFTFSGYLSGLEAWNALWEAARAELTRDGGAQAGVIAIHGWMRDILARTEFRHTHNIVMLEWRGQPALPASLPADVTLRAMTEADLPAVEQADADAFAPMWRISLDLLRRALAQSAIAAVLESRGRLLGYQLSTGKADGVHLARLAVRKEAQGRGLGSALVSHLIVQMRQRGAGNISVNTQDDNPASLAVYRKLGFVRTGESYPVFSTIVDAEGG